jgi:three-Cys-motif partner protein
VVVYQIMPERDLHREPFDAGTLAKLELFKLTAEGFLGVFVGSGQMYCPRIQIFDFFSGPGQDAAGQLGSPVLLLQHLRKLAPIIEEKKYKVSVLLNDAEGAKIAALKSKLQELGLDVGPYELRVENQEFRDLFPTEIEKMRGAANLVLIDQNGVRQFPPEIFAQLRAIPRTDVLAFVSSSYAWRFQDEPEMKKHLETQKIFESSTPFYQTHRAVVAYYRSLVPSAEEYYLAPFSIKKGSNIHGVMFGASNRKGLEKFLEAAWHLDDRTGEANFDIDREGRFSRPGELPIEWGETKKVQAFGFELGEVILQRRLSTTADIYCFTLDRGFLPKHANTVLKAMHNEGKIGKVTGLGYSSLENPQLVVVR